MPSVSGLAISLSLIGVLVVARVARLAYWFLSSIFRVVMIGVFHAHSCVDYSSAWPYLVSGTLGLWFRGLVVPRSVGWWFRRFEEWSITRQNK